MIHFYSLLYENKLERRIVARKFGQQVDSLQAWRLFSGFGRSQHHHIYLASQSVGANASNWRAELSGGNREDCNRPPSPLAG